MALCSCAGKEDRNTHNTVSHTRDEQGHRGTIAFCVHKTPSGEAVMSVKEPWDTAGTKEQQCLVLLLLLLHTPCLNPPPPPREGGRCLWGAPGQPLLLGLQGNVYTGWPWEFLQLLLLPNTLHCKQRCFILVWQHNPPCLEDRRALL